MRVFPDGTIEPSSEHPPQEPPPRAPIRARDTTVGAAVGTVGPRIAPISASIGRRRNYPRRCRFREHPRMWVIHRPLVVSTSCPSYTPSSMRGYYWQRFFMSRRGWRMPSKSDLVWGLLAR
jgi:hypothetical protein